MTNRRKKNESGAKPGDPPGGWIWNLQHIKPGSGRSADRSLGHLGKLHHVHFYAQSSHTSRTSHTTHRRKAHRVVSGMSERALRLGDGILKKLTTLGQRSRSQEPLKSKLWVSISLVLMQIAMRFQVYPIQLPKRPYVLKRHWPWCDLGWDSLMKTFCAGTSHVFAWFDREDIHRITPNLMRLL